VPPTRLELGPDAASALSAIRAASREGPVLVFKQSPICAASHRAESELARWAAALPDDVALELALVDVIAERGLARGLTAELGVRHESPQALWFLDGELAWHGSHGALTGALFDRLLAGAGSTGQRKPSSSA